MPTKIQAQTVFDRNLIERYDVAGPRYTSYPTAVQFSQEFDVGDYLSAVLRSNEDILPASLSLYVHLPFCDTVCYYCACNKIITRNRVHAASYLDRLFVEIERQGALFAPDRVVKQVHWGGGTPTFFSGDQMRELMATLQRNFSLVPANEGEFSIEIDPRTVTDATLRLLKEIGFNRISMGVQDFDERVQKAVNRLQPKEQTLSVLRTARDEGFKSVSMDLIYGLPCQTVDSFGATIDAVIAAGPDRISVFNYAHLPGRFKTQRQIDETLLPTPDTKLEILQRCVEDLLDAGYVYLGMDHFAKPEDELALAHRGKTMTRNFQGYSTHGDCDLIGLGLSAIGKVDNCYAQNAKTLEDYYDRIDAGKLALTAGIELTDEDILRRDVINHLICDFAVDFATIETRHGIKFQTHFAVEMGRLQAMAQDGLVNISPGEIRVEARGRLLIRNICMVFDAYLQDTKQRATFSKAI
jgi:oxygen-independent coproporphyrinogen III oxidase